MAIDLNAARAARAEAEGEAEPKHLLLGDDDFVLPPEVPWDFLELLGAGRVTESYRELLGAEQFKRFWAYKITEPDIQALSEGIRHEYGLPGDDGDGLGKPPASSDSSSNGSRPSRRTSRRTTR